MARAYACGGMEVGWGCRRLFFRRALPEHDQSPLPWAAGRRPAPSCTHHTAAGGCGRPQLNNMPAADLKTAPRATATCDGRASHHRWLAPRCARTRVRWVLGWQCAEARRSAAPATHAPPPFHPPPPFSPPTMPISHLLPAGRGSGRIVAVHGGGSSRRRSSTPAAAAAAAGPSATAGVAAAAAAGSGHRNLKAVDRGPALLLLPRRGRLARALPLLTGLLRCSGRKRCAGLRQQ